MKFTKKLNTLFLDDKFILGLILLNTALIFIQDFDIRLYLLNFFDAFFTLAFTYEMFLKIKYFGFKQYWQSGWNKLDFILVLVSFPSIAVIFFNIDSLLKLNFVLALRTLRIFKFFRILKFIPNIEGMLKSIQRALKSSYLVFIGFFITILVVATISTSLFGHHAPEYFGNPLKSFYSIFRLFTIEGWYEIPNAVNSNMSKVSAFFVDIYFMIILFIGGIIGLSLVNSIFVDSMVADNNDKFDQDLEKLKNQVDELHKKIDKLLNNNP